MKIYIVYDTDGYNSQCVDRVFDTWRKAADYVIERYYSHNDFYKGMSQENLDSNAKEFVHEFEVE